MSPLLADSFGAGLRIQYHINGQRNFSTYLDEADRKQDMFRIWYEDGKLKQIGLQLDGRMIAHWECFYSNGKRETEENYLNGTKHGQFRYFDSLERLVKTELYSQGSLVSAN